MHITTALSVRPVVQCTALLPVCQLPCLTQAAPVPLIIRDSEESAVSLASIKIASGRDMPVNYPIEKVELGEVRGQGKLWSQCIR